MATLIPEVKLEDFLKLNASEMKQLKSSEIYSDGEYLFTFVNPSTSYIRVQTEYMGQLSNSVGGKSLEEILRQSDKYPNLTKARAAKKNKEAVLV